MKRAFRALLLRARAVAAVVIAGLWPGKSAAEVHRYLQTLSLRRQIEVVGGVLLALFLLALFAAQFGAAGLAVYFGAALLLAF